MVASRNTNLLVHPLVLLGYVVQHPTGAATDSPTGPEAFPPLSPLPRLAAETPLELPWVPGASVAT